MSRSIPDMSCQMHSYPQHDFRDSDGSGVRIPGQRVCYYTTAGPIAQSRERRREMELQSVLHVSDAGLDTVIRPLARSDECLTGILITLLSSCFDS